MSRTKTKPVKSRNGVPQARADGLAMTDGAEVLTLVEAAAYLRVAESEIIRLAQQQDLPGRLIGTEWRFLKPALRDWLKSPPATPSKEAVLSRIGSWKDDPDLDRELKEIYERRGRPMTEDAS